MTTSTAVASSSQSASVATSSVRLCPATKREITLAARPMLPASNTTPAANNR